MYCLSWRKAIKQHCHASLRGSYIHLRALCFWFPSLLACCSMCSLISYSRAAWGLISVLDLMHDSMNERRGKQTHGAHTAHRGLACGCLWWTSRLHLKNPTASPSWLTVSLTRGESKEWRRGSNKESSSPPKSMLGWVCFSTTDSSRRLFVL